MELGNAVFGHRSMEVPVPRTDAWFGELVRLFDVYAPLRDTSWREYGENFENDTFKVATYWWGDCTCGAGGESNEHKPDCRLIAPNFLHKPTGFALEWYKYPLRDSYMNRKTTLAQFRAIIDDCIRSLTTLVVSP